MPTKRTKGDHGHADHGSHERGGQKATAGTGLDPKVAEARMQAEGIAPDTPAGDASEPAGSVNAKDRTLAEPAG